MAIAASALLAFNSPDIRAGQQVRGGIRLAAQAAEIPVPRPRPLEPVVDALSISPDAAPPPAATSAGAIAPPTGALTGAAPAPVAPPAKLAAPVAAGAGTEPGTWAVVVGVNDYPGTQYDLHYAVNDANDANQAITQMGVAPDHILNLRDGQVTPGVLHSAITWLDSHAGPDAVAVFFYAGHVMKRGASQVIVTSDGGYVYDTQLADWLRPLPARKAWIAIAACYGGGFNEVLAPGRVLTAAADANNVAYESSAFGRSYLGEYMIHRAMIEGAANQSVESAFAWAQAHISQDYPGREPVEFDQGDGFLNLRPTGTPPQQSAPASSPPADQSGQSPPAASDPAPPPPPPQKKCTPGILARC